MSGSPSTTIDAGNVTSRTMTGLTAGTTYYFRVIAYNTSGQTSAPSAQVSYTVPAGRRARTSRRSPRCRRASGPATGGTQITINGTNFATSGTIRVGGTQATGITRVSSTQLRATTPAGTAGARDVQVINGNGSSATLAGAFTYTATPTTPTLTSVSPTSGPTSGGTTITLTGSNFVSGATVRVAGVAATNVVFSSATQITARTPAGTAGARDVQITNPNGQSATRTGAFTYTATSTTRPSPRSVSPRSGPTAGGTLITVTGSNFENGATIRIGGVAATSVTFVDSRTLTARTPAMPAGGYPVQVFNPNGLWGNTSRGFLYRERLDVGRSAHGGSVESMGAATAELSANATADTAPTEGTFRRYLAEGVETDQMRTQLAIANPQQTDARATLTFETSTGAQAQLAVDVPARSRQTVDLSTVPELAGASFSTLLESDRELALDRLITFGAQGSAASLETAVAQPSATWYFAEGSTVDPQELFYLVQNPGPTEARVRVRYLLPNGASPVVRTQIVAPGSRATIWVDRENPALASTDVAAEITSVNGTPIVVERSSYVRQEGSAAPRGGDTSVGVTAPATRWFVEGATGQVQDAAAPRQPGA